jgi:segregation and condensation protein A
VMEESVKTYKVKAGSFEGPLELLLSLIEEKKLFVNEISLAEVTNEYIAYIKSLQTNDESIGNKIHDISYFIVIAATLILIKSKSLLPNLELTDEEEGKIEDLEMRLRLYQIIKNASVDIKNNFGAKIIFSAPERKWTDVIFSPDPIITVASLSSVIDDVLAHIPKKMAPLPEVAVKTVINIEEMIDRLTERIQKSLNTSFRDFTKLNNTGSNEQEARVNVIVSFLAMLELVRTGIIDVIQNSNFEDITMNNVDNANSN